MSHHWTRPIVAAVVGAVLVCSSSEAQIDHRVNQGNAVSGARALDRNPNIGSGGFNLTRPGFDAGMRSDAIISGNVTGLGRFQGYSPIPQSSAFRDQLQSTSLSGFLSRGVSLRDVTSNQVPATNYFYDPNRTIANVGQIQSGQNLPGSSQLRSTNLAPLTGSTPPVNQPIPNLRAPGDTRMGINTPPQKFGVSQVQIGTRPQPRPVDSVAPTYRAASESPIFGTTLPRVSPPLTEQRSDVARPELAAVEEAGTSKIGVSDSSAGTTPVATFENRPLNEPTAATMKPQEEPTLALQQSKFGSQTPSINEPLPMDGRAPANLGADRFADLYSAVRAAEQIGVRDLAFRPVQAPGNLEKPRLAESANEEPAAPQSGRLERQKSESVKQLANAAKWASDVLERPVDSFVGRNENRLNSYIADGEAALKAKQYYRAADLFDLAHLIDPLNPLPLLHRGHALVAAGDYVSGLGALCKGIERFPQIAAFRMDLPKMVGDSDIFDVRRADLEKQLAEKDSYELRFLLGYLEYYSGLPDIGVENLRRAQKAAPPESTIAEFVRLLTGEKPMPDLPTE